MSCYALIRLTMLNAQLLPLRAHATVSCRLSLDELLFSFLIIMPRSVAC